MFEGKEVVVTEKMDGENTTIYSSGECHARSTESKGHPSRDYVKGKAREIGCMGAPDGWRFMGENLYAKHSIAYDLLPDYFVLFGVADGSNNARPWDEVEEWAKLLDIPHAPVVWRGRWDTKKIMGLYPFKSLFSSSAPAEGYVVRVAKAFPMSQFDKHVAKFVRAGHVQTSEHWMHQAITPNIRKTSSLRGQIVRLAYQKPEFRPALLPLLKRAKSYSRAYDAVSDDYRKGEITVYELNFLYALIEKAKSEQEAMRIVQNHRRGRYP
jgi:hypothetical protein